MTSNSSKILQINFLHQDIQKHCSGYRKSEEYRDCAKKAFDLVRDRYREKFGSEIVPKEFLKVYYIKGTRGSSGSEEDKNFQKGCEYVLRSVNNFRHEVEHTDSTTPMTKKDAMHHLCLCSMALNFLDQMEHYPNNTHPFTRNDYKKEKMSGSIKFNYSNNNGEYRIGKDLHAFTVKVSSCSENSLYVYHDPELIKGVGLIFKRCKDLKTLNEKALKTIDMSSRCRRMTVENTCILLNLNNMYVALNLESAERECGHIAIIEYQILPKG